jgi:RNA polymerase sigma factor (sigma-70 family)
MGVGLRVLRCHQKAEDVCQATFLLLAKKAHNTAWRDCVANWLYGVAFNLSREALKAEQRRAAHEAAVPAKPAPDAVTDVIVRELQEILDEEIARLPAKYRCPVVLCCLEGKTRDEVAVLLDESAAVIKTRLEAGRERLRRQLARRGVQFSVALAGFTLSSVASAAGLSPSGVQAVTRSALQVVNGGGIAGVVRPEVVTLFNQGARSMFLTKLKVMLAVVFTAGLVIAGAGVVSQAAPGDEKGKPTFPGTPPPAPKAKAGDAPKPEEPKPEEKKGEHLPPPIPSFPKAKNPAPKPTEKVEKVPGTIGGLTETTVRLENAYGTTAFEGRGILLDARVTKDTKVTLGGKPAQLKDLANGMPVVIHRESDGPVTLIEAEYRESNFDVKAVDAEKKTLTLTVAGTAGPSFDIAVKEDAKFAGAGKPTKLADIKPGVRVALKLDDTGRIATSLRVLRDFEK